jgi:hypothetical protein
MVEKSGFISSQEVKKSVILQAPPNFSGVLKIPLFDLLSIGLEER